MEIENIFEVPLEVEMDCPVSKAVSRMLGSGRQEAVVMDGSGFCGILSARDLVKTSIANPESTSISPFIRRINPVHFMTGPKDMMNMMLINDYRSLPVEKEGRIFVINKLGLLRLLKKELDLKAKTVDEVMNFPFSIDAGDSISTARAIIRDMHVSVVILLDDKDRVDGIIDALSLLKSIVARSRSRRGEEDGEKIRLEDMPAKSISSKDFIMAESGAQLSEVLDKMIAINQQVALIGHDGRIAGIMTPRDIMKIAGTNVEGVRVAISGMQDEDEFIRSIVSEEIERELSKLSRFMPISLFAMHIRRYHEKGSKTKYSIHARLITDRGGFFAEDYAWDLIKATKGMLAKIEKEVIKKHEKSAGNK